jgi:hypothetical protein
MFPEELQFSLSVHRLTASKPLACVALLSYWVVLLFMKEISDVVVVSFSKHFSSLPLWSFV